MMRIANSLEEKTYSRAQKTRAILSPGRFLLESRSSSAASLPFPHMPQENGKFSQDSQHLPPALGRLRAARRGRETALTWHTKPPYTSGGRRHSEVRGPPLWPVRQREIPAAAEPRTYPPQAAFSLPPAAPRARRWRRLGARGLAAGAGRAWWRPGLAIFGLPREGGPPGAAGIHPRGAALRPGPRPGLPASLLLLLRRPPARNRFM